jgi:hypothetical protein
MKEAFNFMFKDNMFVKKAMTYACVAFIANFISNYANTLAPMPNTMPSIKYLLIFFVGAILMLIPSGYGMSCVKAFVEQKENFVIPFLNIKTNFVLGFKLAISVIFMSLIFGLVIVLTAMLSAIIFSLINAVSIGAILVGIVVAVAVLVVTYYSLAFCYIFATTEKFSSFLQFRNATNMIRKDFKHYTLSVILFVVLSILTGILGTILIALLSFIGIIGLAIATFIISIISGYTIYFFTYLTAKSIRE